MKLRRRVSLAANKSELFISINAINYIIQINRIVNGMHYHKHIQNFHVKQQKTAMKLGFYPKIYNHFQIYMFVLQQKYFPINKDPSIIQWVYSNFIFNQKNKIQIITNTPHQRCSSWLQIHKSFQNYKDKSTFDMGNEDGSQRDLAGSLIQDANSDDDLRPQQLSGDQSSQRSLLVSDITGAKANFLLTVTTIMKTVIGAGILSLPYTISRLGYVLGLIMFAIIISIVQFSAVMLLKAKNLSKHSNYSSISYHIFRTKFAQIICSLAILVNNIGICIVELTIIKELVRELIVSYHEGQEFLDKFYTSPAFIVLIASALLMPFTLVNKIEKLKFLAFFGVTGITVFVTTLTITFFIQMPERDWECHTDVKPFADASLGMATVIPNMMLALAYQMNFFPIFKGMKDSRDEKMAKASLSGVCACSIFYILVGNMGYCLLGKNLKANFLLAFTREQIAQGLYLTMYIGFLISVFFSFPVMFFGGRNNFIAIINNIMMLIRNKSGEYKIKTSDNVQEISSYIQTQNKIKRKRKAKILFIVYTLLLFAIAISIAASVHDIEDVFNVVGAIASNAISFIFPSMFYALLIQKKNKPRKLHYWIAVVLFIFFIPFGIFSVVSKFLN